MTHAARHTRKAIGLIVAMLALAFSMVMMIAPRAYAGTQYLSGGTVNASDLIAGEDYCLTDDTTINIDADVAVGSIDINSYNLAVTGDTEHTLDVPGGISDQNEGSLTVDSGKLRVAMSDSRSGWVGAIDLAQGLFTMNGGDLYISYTSSGESVYTAYGLDAGSFTMTGGSLNVSCLCYYGSARAISCNHDFTMSGGTITAWAGTNEAGGNDKSAAGIATSSTADASLLISGGKVTAHAECAVGQYAYGLSWTNGEKPENTTVISGGAVAAWGVDYGIQSWAPMTITGTANVEAHAEESYALLVTDDLTLSGSCKVTAVTEDTGCSAIAAEGTATMESDLRITTPLSGQWKNVSPGYDQVCDHLGNKAQNVVIEAIPANYHRLGLSCWDYTTGTEITEGPIQLALNGANTGESRYVTYLEEGTSYTIDTVGMPEGWTWKGWQQSSPGDTGMPYLGRDTGYYTNTMGTADVWYYAVFESPKTVIGSMTLATSFVPVAGDVAARPEVTAEEEGISVGSGQWYDEFNHPISADHVFTVGEKVQLRVGYHFNNTGQAHLYAFAPDIEDHVTVNGYAPDVFRHDNEQWVGVDYVIAEDPDHIPSCINITYDASKVFPTTRLSGRDVSMYMLKYTTSNPGYSMDGQGWKVYACNPSKTDTSTSKYTCLVKKGTNGYETLDSDSTFLNTDDEYYLCFNIEEDGSKTFNTAKTYTAKVNDAKAEDVKLVGGAIGELYVYKKVDLVEDTDKNVIWSLSVHPSDATVQRGTTSRPFEVETVAATNDAVVWSIDESTSPGTTISPDGRLTVASDEESNSIKVIATSAIDTTVSNYEYASITNDPVGIEWVSIAAEDSTAYAYRDTYKEFTATVVGNDTHDLTWEVMGASSSKLSWEDSTGAGVSIAFDETADTITVRATSKADPTKYSELVLTVLDKMYVSPPLDITFDASAVSLSTNKTEFEVNKEFVQSITSSRSSSNPWYVFGSTDGTGKYTGLVKKEGNYFTDSALHSSDKLSADEDYYLWFNIEPGYYYQFDTHDDSILSQITVNGAKPDVVKWGGTIEVYVKVDFEKWERLFGAGRYDTMAAIVGEGFDSSDWAVIATGGNYPDALAASALAGYYDCPVILTETASLSPQAKAQLERLNVKNVYIMGGTGAVSQATEESIAALNGGVSITRIAGLNRLDTSVEAMNVIPRVSDTVIIATGQGYADTLSIGPWSYATCSPIVLTKSDGTLEQSEVDAIKEAGYTKFILVGGTGVVSDQVKNQLEPDLEFVTRLGGANRYATSQLIAEFSLANGLSAGKPAIATGGNYPDALAGAALCGSNKSIMVLVNDKSSAGIATLAANRGSILHGYVFGGTGAVSDSLMNYVANATK